MTHSWGPLGSWAGQVLYVPTAKKDNLFRIDYAYQMQYIPPKVKPAGPRPTTSTLQPLAARGYGRAKLSGFHRVSNA